MAHITVPKGVPGIRGLVQFRPETGKPLYELAQVLLRGESPLSEAERELMAAYVSSVNHCRFCTESHAAAARELYGTERKVVDQVLEDLERAPIGAKFRTLLLIAGKVCIGGKSVTKELVETAKGYGASDREIHDAVLIAAAFCMYNRYVDGLASWSPKDPKMYAEMGKYLAKHGYQSPK